MRKVVIGTPGRKTDPLLHDIQAHTAGTARGDHPEGTPAQKGKTQKIRLWRADDDHSEQAHKGMAG